MRFRQLNSYQAAIILWISSVYQEIKMTINCPHCKGELTVSAEYIGKTINCPHCQRKLTFSGDVDLVAAVDKQLPPTDKICPDCKSKIAQDANTCPFCGTDFSSQSFLGCLLNIIFGVIIGIFCKSLLRDIFRRHE